jgi:hypothetical protein
LLYHQPGTLSARKASRTSTPPTPRLATSGSLMLAGHQFSFQNERQHRRAPAWTAKVSRTINSRSAGDSVNQGSMGIKFVFVISYTKKMPIFLMNA